MLILMLAGPAFAAAKQIAIVPFKVNADKDVSFLRDGIYDMLSSRLYKEGEVEVISRPAGREGDRLRLAAASPKPRRATSAN